MGRTWREASSGGTADTINLTFNTRSGEGLASRKLSFIHDLGRTWNGAFSKSDGTGLTRDALFRRKDVPHISNQ